jgi:hypothetical protein
MKQETLFESNPYLHDNSSYADQLVANVTSSTAIELGKVKPAIRKALTATTRQKN